MTTREYAIEVGGTVLSPRRYNSAREAEIERLVRNANELENHGHVLVERKVVGRKIVIGDWKEEKNA